MKSKRSVTKPKGSTKTGRQNRRARNETFDRSAWILAISTIAIYMLGAFILLSLGKFDAKSWTRVWTELASWGAATESTEGWFLPAMLTGVFAAYAVIIGATVAGGPQAGRATRDNMAIAATAISIATAVSAILTIIWTTTHPSRLPELLPVLSVSSVIVGLGAKVATFYVGNPVVARDSAIAELGKVERQISEMDSRAGRASRSNPIGLRRAWLGILTSALIPAVATTAATVITVFVSGEKLDAAGALTLAEFAAFLAGWDTAWAAIFGFLWLTQFSTIQKFVMIALASFVGATVSAQLLFGGITSPKRLVLPIMIIAVLGCAILAVVLGALPWRRWVGTRSWFTLNTAVAALAAAALRRRANAAKMRAAEADAKIEKFIKPGEN